MPKIMSLKKMALIFWLALLLIPASLWAQRLELVASYDSLAHAEQIVFRGNTAYVATWGRGLAIADVTDPAAPVLLGQFRPQWGIFHFDVRDTIACLATGSSEPYAGKFDVVSVADPAHPYLLGSITYMWEVMEVVIIGDKAYIYSYSGSHVIDISDPSTPTDLGPFDAGEYVADLEYNGYLYAANGMEGGISVLSMADPLHPVIIANCATPGSTVDIALSDDTPNHAYAACTNSGFQMVDISNPEAPVVVTGMELDSRAISIDAFDSLVFVVGDSQLFAIDASEPDDLQLIDTYSGINDARCVKVFDRYIFVGGYGSMKIFWLVPEVAEYPYTPGDVNHNGAANGIDVTYAVSFFKGGAVPPYSCNCPNQGFLYPAGDVNGSCQFNGIDITYFVKYAQGGPPLRWCVDCPPISTLRHEDLAGLCQQDAALDDTSYMVLEVIGDDLHIHHMDVMVQCCLEYFVEYNIRGFEITAMERDIGPQCDCICPFDLKSVVYDLAPGEYRVTLIDFWNQIVGSDTISVGGR